MLISHISFKKLVLCAFALCAGLMVNAQTRTIQGKVTGASGEALSGVTVSVPGTTVGTLTDEDGKYSLNVPATATTLQFSFIGLNPVTETIGDRTTINVVLQESTLALDEIVVVGYGTVKKRDLTGAVSSVKSDEIVKTSSSNALQSIQGKVAGLDITRESGETGSAINMTLRGVRSVNASNAPLFLVDGIEYGSTLDINPSDIASIEVLKDASSTAIYGTRGANGVVIITTKRGTMGKQRSTISFNSYLSLNSAANLPRTMTVQEEYRFMVEKLRFAAEDVADTWGSTSVSDYTPETVLSNVVTSPWEKSVLQLYNEGGVNWYDLMLHNSISQNYELSLNGGDDKTTYVLSIGYRDENGILKNDELKRYNGRLNIEHQFSKMLRIGSNIQFTYRDWDRRQDGVYSQLIKMHSMAQPYLADGSILDKPSELTASHTNPLLNEVEGYYANNTLGNRIFGNVFATLDIVKNLQFKTVLGIDGQSSREGEYVDYMCTGSYQSGRSSFMKAKNIQDMGYTLENTLTYKLNLNDNNQFDFLLGQSAQKSVLETHLISGYGTQYHYGKNSFYKLGNIVTMNAPVDEYIEQAMLSFFGRINYKLMGKYLLTATLRGDGASVLAPGAKWDYFPSVAAAWVVSDENFMKNVSAVDHLKLRASWGKAGNAAVKPYSTVTSLGADPVYYSFGSSVISGYVPANIGNKELTWETTSTYDAGIDISLLKERITATVDLYYSRTTDLLLYKGLPATSVYPQVLENVGETENKGLEASLGFKVINTKDFSWNSDFVYSMNRDKLIALASGETQDVSNEDEALVVGEPVSAFYGYEADGCWSIADAATAATFGKVPGAVKIVDNVADGVINSEDKILYSKSPKFILGWTNTLSYKGLSLSAQVYARMGQWIQYDYNTSYKPTEQDGSPALDYWTPENQGAKIPRPGIQSQNDFRAIGFENASFIKIRDITLGYDLPQTIIEKVKLNRLRIYSSLQNYFTFSNLDNYDPERGGNISNPMTKQVVFGINVEF